MAYDGTLAFLTKISMDGFQAGIDGITGIAQKGLQATTAILSGAAAAFSDIVKEATDSVARLEQNIGGIETLFGTQGAKSAEEYAKLVGKSVDEVKTEFQALEKAQAIALNNANEAYRTAGLSANDYMSTVTSFAASLKQSTEDEVEAAAVANQAVIDMSDNANKMGSNMQDIQNAYQGFAKQNYTMLDNLKLGYGGTKTEMERLLADAEKISGVKYDINNLKDVYNAVHVIQGELGITGTTAKEAASTIEGSMNSAKAAWDNLLNGSASAGEFAEAVRVATGVIVGNLAEIIPRMSKTISELAVELGKELPSLIGTLAPLVIDSAVGLVTSFCDGLKRAPGLAESGASLVTALAAGLMACVDEVWTTAIVLVGKLAEGLAEGAPQMVQAASSAILDIVECFVEWMPDILQAGVGIILALAEGIVSAIPMLLTQAAAIITNLVEGLASNIPALVEAAIQLVGALVEGLTGAIPVLLEGAITLFMAILEALPVVIEKLLQALPGLVTTIIDFFTQNIPLIIDGAVRLLNGIIEAIPTIIQAIVNNLPQIITALVNGLVGALPQLLEASITLLMALIEAIPEIVAAIAENLPQIITAISTGLVEAMPTIFSTAKELLWEVIEAVPEIVAGLAEAVPDIVAGIVKGLTDGVGAVWDAAIELGSSILDGIKSFFGIHSPSTVMEEQGDYLVQGMIGGLKALPGEALEIFLDVLGKATEWGRDMLSTATAAAQEMLDGVVEWLSQMPGDALEIFTDTLGKATEWGEGMLSTATTAAQEMLDGVVEWLSQMPGDALEIFTDTLGKATEWGEGMLSTATAAAKDMLDGVVGWVSQLPGGVGESLLDTMGNVAQFALDMAGKASEAAAEFVSCINEGISGLPGQMADVGAQICSGIWSGISSGWDWLTGKVSDVAGSLFSAAKKALGIKSPSKVFADEVGRWIPPGIGEGVEKAMPGLERQVGDELGRLAEEMQAAVDAETGGVTIKAAARAGHEASREYRTGGDTYVEEKFEQHNTYNVPTATPGEVARAQREAARKLLGGVA